MDDLLEFIFEVFPPGLATAIVGVLGLGAGIGGFALRSHEAATIAACNSSEGQFAQTFSGSASENCGLASLLHLAGLGVGIIGLLVAVLAALGFWYLASHDKLRSFGV